MEQSREQRFKAWLSDVDTILKQKIKIGSADLPDADYETMFDAEYTPIEAAHEIIIDNGCADC